MQKIDVIGLLSQAMKGCTVKITMGLLGLIIMASAAVSANATVPGAEPFTKARFDALQQAGELILVNISATWCPTCKEQAKILSEYKAQYPEVKFHILTVDFDTQKEWVTYFKAPRQSTFVLFAGTKQVWFSVAETQKEKIFSALNTAHSGA